MCSNVLDKNDELGFNPLNDKLFICCLIVVKLRLLKHMPIIPLKNIEVLPRNDIRYKNLMLFILLFFHVLSFGQEHKIITAKNGDGIYKVLRDNNIPLSYYNQFKELNKDVLKGSHELKIGVKYKLPIVGGNNASRLNSNAPIVQQSGKTVQRYPIFGPKYQDVTIESNELSGGVYYLIPGHGGPDPGAVAKYNGKTLCEDEYAYDITLRLARNLITKGAQVYMIVIDPNDGIRDGWYLPADKDEVCYPNLPIPLNHVARLKQRTDAVNLLFNQNRGKYQRLIEIHIDSRSQGQKIDVFFYHDKQSTNGQKLATTLRDTFDRKYRQHQPGRGYSGTVSERNLYVLKNSHPVAAFIELGNINHERDLRRIIVDDNRQALANWLAEGIVIDYKNNKK
jgi:N-acetylmuramoyl-L-alanine amidase